MANPNPVTDHLLPWQPGQSGNPGGYSRGRRITAALVALIEEQAADRGLAEVWLSMARAGDFKFFKELLDRVEGKVPQPVAEADPATLPDATLTPEAAAAMIQAGLDAKPTEPPR